VKKLLVFLRAVVTRLVTIAVYKIMPPLRLAVTRFQYNLAAKMYSHQDYKFINCGFSDLNGKDDTIDFSRPENLCVLWEGLYRRVVGPVALAGKDVLEVGCGRGGGSEYMMTKLKPRSLVALDLSDVAIARCSETYRIPGLSFQEGNACALPFEDGRFDVVVNVESSHCYPSQEAFLREVLRVLRPGGHFCFADITDASGHTARLNRLFEELGFTVLQKEDITANVVKSLTLVRDTPQFAEAFTRWESPNKRSSMKIPLMVINNTLKDLRSGKEYQRWVVQRPLAEAFRNPGQAMAAALHS
jgi:SAM-dependent methyltransferase